jgi:hypothetical protein
MKSLRKYWSFDSTHCTAKAGIAPTDVFASPKKYSNRARE